MNALLLIAHGSRIGASNDEVRTLAGRLREETLHKYDHVDCAFLELAEPSIPAAIEEAVAMGCERIRVLPYFLAAGNHVISDIPEIIAQKQVEHPGVKIDLRPYAGTAPGMVELLLSLL